MVEAKAEIEKLDKWADSFKAIGNALRLGLLFMLYGSEVLSGDRKSLTFGEMRQVLGYPNSNRANSNLSYHLSALIDASFVEKEPRQAEKGVSEVETIYHLSAKGRSFLEDFNVVQVIEEKLRKKA
jgi:DNA-binding transcriptional ArsR family regulator